MNGYLVHLFLSSFASMRTSVLLLLLLSFVAVPPLAPAQQIESWELRFDNDALALRGAGASTDYDYTHGLQLTAMFPMVPRPLRGWMRAEHPDSASRPRASTRVSVGQRLYTPRREGIEPVPGERPHAAWLFWSVDVLASRSGTEQRLGVELGITGPAALGEPVQNGFHRLVGSPLREGWDHELVGEPAGLLHYAAGWPREIAGARLRPRVEVGLGTLWSGAAGEMDLHIGARPEATGLYAEGKVRQEWVARNLFLDGNTFRASVRTDKGNWVSEAALGVGYRFSHWAVEYRFVVRSREYRSQPGPHEYGSVAVWWRR